MRFQARAIALACMHAVTCYGHDLAHRVQNTHITHLSGPLNLDAPLVLLVESSSQLASKSFNPALVVGLIKQHFKRDSTALVHYTGDYVSDLEQRRLSPKLIGSPKLILQIHAQQAPNKSANAQIALTLIRYRLKGGGLHPSAAWTEHRAIESIAQRDIEDWFLSETATLLKSIPRVKTQPPATVQRSSQEPKTLYKTRWVDPEPLRNQWVAGVSFGPPALINLQLGYWGGVLTPVIAQLSAMFWDNQNRGIQMEAAWAFWHHGTFRHSLGVVGGLYPHTDTQRTTNFDFYGRPESIVTHTTWALRPGAGLLYAVQRNHLRLGLGVTRTLDGTDRWNPLLHLGLHIPLGRSRRERQ